MTMNSTISCIPSTLNFVCDVDGVHTEIPIPANAWDFENETVWLTQAQLEELYACSHANLVGHIGNIYDDEELQESSTCRKFRQVQLEGNREVSREVKQYNLEMLIALGYRIRSKVATTGSYSIRKPDSYMIENPIERAKRWIEETEEWQKALSAEETAHAETKALLAEEQEKFKMLIETVVSEQLTVICAAHPEREQWRLDSNGTRLFPKWACDILDKVYEDDDMFLMKYRTE